jgi:hypothetical protein
MPRARTTSCCGDVEREAYLQRFLELIAKGQTVALDILFAPEWAMVEPPAPEWRVLAANRPRLLARNSAASTLIAGIVPLR